MNAVQLAQQATMVASVRIVDGQSRAMAERAARETQVQRLTGLQDVLRAAMMALLDACYERTPGGQWVGHDGTGRLRQGVVVPWSGKNYSRYGLTRSQRDALQWLITRWPLGFWDGRHTVDDCPAAILTYDSVTTRWTVNLAAYPTKASVLPVLQVWPTIETLAWLDTEQSRQRSAERMQRLERQRVRR